MWARYDPDATGLMEWTLLNYFLDDIPPPMGFDKKEKNEKLEFLRNTDFKLYVAKDSEMLFYYFHDVMMRLT